MFGIMGFQQKEQIHFSCLFIILSISNNLQMNCNGIKIVAETKLLLNIKLCNKMFTKDRNNQRTNGHLISWPSKAQNIQNLENIY